MIIQASAPGKIILCGEHAVVYGHPAIAVPISSLRAHARVEPSPDGDFTLFAADLGEIYRFSPAHQIIDNALIQMSQLVLRHYNVPPPPLQIHISSQIPIASGMGSGAAISTALGRALSRALGFDITDDILNGLVYEVEKTYHGTPSGVDNTVIVYEKPVYFIRGAPIESVSLAKPIVLLIADSGEVSLTRVAVGAVRHLYETERARIEPILVQIGELVRSARQALANGDIVALGRLFVDNHHCLRDLTVSSPRLDRLVHAALDAGAYGAKLSGAGRGGNMIALVDENLLPKVERALLNNGATSVLTTLVYNEG